jgi:hypothetical protein
MAIPNDLTLLRQEYESLAEYAELLAQWMDLAPNDAELVDESEKVAEAMDLLSCQMEAVMGQIDPAYLWEV